ncbi:MAG: nucleotidyl transferase AbiEii/AbiGii toxin family protein [Candidatus Caenarcaniphilales bacterium]|jgi:predicted nucleotidyltransferase component of viral defense system|nr:nucleotidyl transferase AbiEii/AbiGii toxin family protein [Candidatus Caenarcaniphilales bacterium]
MIDVLKDKLNNYDNDKDKFNKLREELQLIILRLLDEYNHFRNIAFLGGTSLRILYKIRRYSEDLDFSLVNKESYSFQKIIEDIDRGLTRLGLKTSFKIKKRDTAVKSAFIRFTGLLYELGLSPLKDQNIAIKFEIDENPPTAYNTEFSNLAEMTIIGIKHFDKPSLFAGKLHAVLSRPYPKGRDYFDLLWFISEKIKPNLLFLQNALEQSRGSKSEKELDINLLRLMLLEKIQDVDFAKVNEDLSPFIMDDQDRRKYSPEIFVELIERYFISDIH